MTGLAAAATAQQDLTARDWAALVAPLTARPLTGAASVLFVAAATEAQTPAASAYWQAHGGTPFLPEGTAPEHFYVVYTTSLDGRPNLPTGTDLSGVGPAVQTLERARTDSRVVASDAYVLRKDRDLPREQQQQSIVLAAPVGTPSAAPGPSPDQVRGWVLMSARARDLAAGTLADAGQGLINVGLTGRTHEGADVQVASVRTGQDAHGTRPRDVPVDVVRRTWTLRVQSTEQAERLRGGYLRLGRVLLVGGAALSALLALLAWLVLSSRARSEARVRAATSRLREAEEQARSQAVLLDAVVDSIAEGVGVIDAQARPLLFNQAAREMLDLQEGDPLTSPERWALADGTTPFPFDRLPLQRALRGESPATVDLVLRGDEQHEPRTIAITARPLSPSAGIPGGAVAVYRDVSQARRLQRQLAEQHRVQQRLLAALSDLGEGVVVTEAGRVVYANAAYAALTGYSAEELRELDLTELPADQQAADVLTALVDELGENGRLSSAVTTRLRHREGHAVPIEATGISIASADGLQRVCLVRDLSERQRTQAELADRAAALEQANDALTAARDAARAASAAKSEFVARMSHEIRTPLNGVLGLTSLLCRTSLTDEQRQLAETAARSGEALLHVVNDILDFSKIEAGKLAVERVPLDLAELVHDTADLFATAAEAKGLDLLVDCAPLPVLSSDPVRLRQVLGNLVGNALKFTASGHVTLAARPGPGGVVLTVSDSGVGISAEAQGRLFTAFEQADSSTTRHYGGTGLGLTISRQLAELLGGTLTCRSAPGQGSTFRLVLPWNPAEPSAAPALDLSGALRGQRVLVLTPSPHLRAHLTARLGAWGATVVALRDEQRADDPGPVDRAVVDVRLPDAADLLAGLAARVPVVALHALGGAPTLPDGATGLPLPARSGPLLDLLRPARDGVPPQRPAREPAVPDAPHGRSLHVLVADDNAVNRMVAELLLDQLGHTCDSVADGREAVDAAARGHYDVVLMDCQMPGTDGLQATRLLRGLPDTRDLPVLALTAGATTEERDACLAAGMDAWLDQARPPRGPRARPRPPRPAPPPPRPHWLAAHPSR